MSYAAALPSYEDAIVASDNWVSLAAPYVSASDYPSLCLVSRRFNNVFTPMLWRDPLVTIRKLGLDPADGSLLRPAVPSTLLSGCPSLSCSPIFSSCIPSTYPASYSLLQN